MEIYVQKYKNRHTYDKNEYINNKNEYITDKNWNRHGFSNIMSF